MIENIEPATLVDFIGHTNAAIEKSASAVAELDTLKAQQAKVASLIPDTVAELLANNRIEPRQKEAAEKALQDPVQTLMILKKLASHRNDKELPAVGTPVAEGFGKTAAFQPIGGRSSTMKESDRALFASFGVAVTD